MVDDHDKIHYEGLKNLMARSMRQKQPEQVIEPFVVVAHQGRKEGRK
jgi:hypothetical protein